MSDPNNIKPECLCCGCGLVAGETELCEPCGNYHKGVAQKVCDASVAVPSQRFKIVASAMAGIAIGIGIFAIIETSHTVGAVQSAVDRTLRERDPVAFDQGALAGMQAGINRYIKTVLNKTTEEEKSNIVNVIFEDIKTNAISKDVWATFHRQTR